MKEIVKNNKKNLLIIIIFLILIVIQSILFLKTPNYIANNLNYTIEKKGIETPIPEIMSMRSMNSLNAIMQSEDIINYYTLTSKGDDEYVKKYKCLNNQDIYILKKLDAKEEKKLYDIMLKATSLYTMFSQSAELNKMDFRPDATVINYYMGLPDDNEIKKIYSSYETLDEPTKKSNAISFVLDEYTNLQYDIKDLENNYLSKKIIDVLLILTISLLIMLITNYLSRKLTTKIINGNHSINKSRLNLIIKNCLFIPIVLIGSLINIITIDKKWGIYITITVIFLFLLSIIPKIKPIKKKLPKLKTKVSTKIDTITERTAILIKPIILIIITIMGIISMLTIPEKISYINTLEITSYILEIILTFIISVIIIKKN